MSSYKFSNLYKTPQVIPAWSTSDERNLMLYENPCHSHSLQNALQNVLLFMVYYCKDQFSNFLESPKS